MDNITLGYSKPEVSGMKLRMYASAQNLFVMTKYTGLDPEIQNGVDNNLYPRARYIHIRSKPELLISILLAETNMRKYTTFILLGIASVACTDPDVTPKGTAVSDVVFTDPDSYRAFMAKLYAGLAVTGQQGPAGDADIKGIDEGASDYIRGYWNLQELTTDEAVIGWNDGTIQTLHAHTWTAQSEFINGVFNRFFYQISIANQFLRETTDAKLSSRGVADDLRAQIKTFRAEARLLRALSYWHALDLFRQRAFPYRRRNRGYGCSRAGGSRYDLQLYRV